MNILGRTNVTIFLAVTLVAGIFSLIAPSFHDVEATGDRHGKSLSVKKFICNQNNIDFGGIGIDIQPGDITSTLTEAQEQLEGNEDVTANSVEHGDKSKIRIHENGEKRNHENGVKTQGHNQRDNKDVVFICINNNNGNVPPVEIKDCLDCFVTTNNGGFLPPGQLTNIIEALEEVGSDLEEFCDAIKAGEFTEEEIRDFLEEALPGNDPQGQQRLINLLTDCLSQFIPEETPIITTTP